ncbi:MAG TPA: CHAT domain-containing protein [Mycobacteriales bacterium]|nr:CHAT domain-containing protein [Mycobacteriales bacterium]
MAGRGDRPWDGVGASSVAVSEAFRRADAALRLAGEDPARARVDARGALVLARQAGDGAAAAQAERALGMAARSEQDVVTAAVHLGRAVRLAEQAGEVGLAAQVRVSRALALAYAGRIDAAHEDLDRAAEVLGGADLARVELQRAGILQMQGRLEEADERFGRALPLLTRAGDREALAILYNNRGLLRSRRGLLARAEADLRQAVVLHQQLGHLTAAGEVSQNLGLVAARRGDVMAALEAFEEVDQVLARSGAVDAVGLLDRSEALLAGRLLVEARATAERAVDEQERRNLTAYLAEARLVLARVALCEGRYAEARELAERSGQAFARQHRASYRALAADVRIRAAWGAGERTPTLLAASRRVAAELEANGWLVAAADARLVAAQVAIALGRHRTARAELAGLSVPRRYDPAEMRSRAFYGRALLHLTGGDRRRADVALRAGMASVERLRRDLCGTELRAHASGHATDIATLGLRLAVEDGRPAGVLRWAERWRASTLSTPPVEPPRDEELAEALGQLRQLASTSGLAGAGVRSASRQRRQVALERTVRRLARGRRLAARYEPRLVSASMIRAELGDQALVEWVDVGGELYAVVLTRRGQSLHKLGETVAAARLVTTQRFWLRRLVYGFGAPAALARAQAEAAAAAERLDELLLRPLHTLVEDRPLVVVPTAALHALPWTMLPSCTARPVSIAPSAGWWRAATVPPAAGDGDRDGGTPGRTVLVSGPGLEHGPAEVEALRALYPDAVRLVGPAATTGAVTDALDGAGLAHVATHGTFRADQPLLSSLQLADGPMTVYDLERLRAAPRLLILASCDAGLSDVLPGDELMGLAACVLAQGTTALVAPVLPVPDADTRPVMLALHRHLRTGHRPAAALAATRTEMAGEPHALTAAIFTCLGAG